MNTRVLIVDDDESLVDGLRRMLQRHFEVHVALGGSEALREIARQEQPFAVIVADMNMPGLNGVQLLQRVERESPDSTRLMLTGVADLAVAKKAVNEGHIFQFLSKPCPPAELVKAIQEGIGRFERLQTERGLLDETFRGAVKVLSDVLAVANPAAFGRTQRIHRLVCELLAAMRRDLDWELDVAVLLSQLGTVALPPELLEKSYRGVRLNADEQKRFEHHCEVAAELLRPIPRLEKVREIIRFQCTPATPRDEGSEPTPGAGAIPFGARVLQAALDFDGLACALRDPPQAFARMEQTSDRYDPEVLAALRSVAGQAAAVLTQPVLVKDLRVGMVFTEAVTSRDGLMLVARGAEATPTVLEKLRIWAEADRVLEPLVVRGSDANRPMERY